VERPYDQDGERRLTAPARWLAAMVALLLVGAVAAAALSSARDGSGPGSPRALPLAAGASAAPNSHAAPASTAPPTTRAPAVIPPGPVPMAGCPPPPPPSPCAHCPPPPHPGTLVPDAQLPAAPAPTAHVPVTAVIAGKGMWIWILKSTEGGDVQAIVDRAKAAGLTQIWVRIADSWDGFYGGHVLDALAPAAHAAGIDVVGWGFPYFYDPVGDARWTAAALSWRGSDGRGIDAFSPDIETSSEGVVLTARRTTLYLGLVRQAAAGRPIVATVFPPTSQTLTYYPFAAMAPYVDAFAPMVYWGCLDPGQAAVQAVTRLAPLVGNTPIHLIGQAYNMASEGGRQASPSRDETLRFLDVAKRSGAVGASFYVWQDMTADEWSALVDYAW
jgi:hypothetical protein